MIGFRPNKQTKSSVIPLIRVRATENSKRIVRNKLVVTDIKPIQAQTKSYIDFPFSSTQNVDHHRCKNNDDDVLQTAAAE